METITTATPKQAPPANSLLIPASAWFGVQRGVAQPVPLTQYDDTLPVLAVALYLNGQPYTVPEGAAVNVRMDKRDGHYIYNPAYGVSDDRKTVYVAVTLQMTTGAGEYWPILELVVDGDVAGTSVLPLYIAKNPVPEDAVESSDEWKSVRQIAAEVEEAAQVLQDNAEGLQWIRDNVDTVEAVSGNVDNIAAVAGNTSNINTVAASASNINTVVSEMKAIKAAPTAASNAANSATQARASATLSESWAVGGTGTRSGEDTDNAKYYAEQAQQIAQGALGWYATPQALRSAHPTGQNGQWAIVGTTDTIWIWDSDTSAWVDSGSNMDLSQYYTKTEADARFLGAGDETVVRFVEISIDEETGAVTFTDPQFDFAFLAGCIRHDGETCAVRVKGVVVTYSPYAWSEADDGAVTLSFRAHGYIGDSSGQRVYRAPTLEITQRGGAVTGRLVTYIYNTLPSVDASDDGKTLRVVDGAWQVMTPPAYSKVQKIWENPSPTAEYAAQTISVPGLAAYDMIIIFTNANGYMPYAYNPPTMAPKMGANEISVTSYQGTFTRGFTVNFAAQTIAIGDAHTAGIDNRYLVPALIFGIKF